MWRSFGLASSFAKASDFAKASSDKSEDKSEAALHKKRRALARRFFNSF